MRDELTTSSPNMLLAREDVRVEFTGKNLTKFGGIQLVRKFILKLQEDWAYREEYKEAEERLEGLAWIT